MTDREFLEETEVGTPIEPASPLWRKLDELSWKARWITNYMNCVTHRPHIVRAILERLTGREVRAGVIVQPPFYTQIGIGLHFGRGVQVDQDVHLLDVAGIHLGDDTVICSGVTVMSSLPGVQIAKRDILYPLPVHIGRRVWIGPGAIIMPGVVIGDGAIISPGSLVSEEVLPGTVAAGRPAHYVRDI